MNIAEPSDANAGRTHMSRLSGYSMVLAIVVIASALTMAFSPSIRGNFTLGVWLLQEKITGELHGVAWSEIVELMLPTDRRPKPRLDFDVTVTRVDDENPQLVLWDTPLGTFWGLSVDALLMQLLLHEQLVEKIYHNDIVSVRDRDIVLDVGSHIGVFTRIALNAGAKLVVAFEPGPTNVACFRKTFEQEISDGRVILVEAAAWDTPGTLNFEIQEGGGASSVGSVNQNGELIVYAVTIDDVVKKLALERVDFIKMDIEGAERHALKGARKTLSSFAPRMALSAYHSPEDRRILPELATDAQPAYRVRKTFKYVYFLR